MVNHHIHLVDIDIHRKLKLLLSNGNLLMLLSWQKHWKTCSSNPLDQRVAPNFIGCKFTTLFSRSSFINLHLYSCIIMVVYFQNINLTSFKHIYNGKRMHCWNWRSFRIKIKRKGMVYISFYIISVTWLYLLTCLWHWFFSLVFLVEDIETYNVDTRLNKVTVTGNVTEEEVIRVIHKIGKTATTWDDRQQLNNFAAAG